MDVQLITLLLFSLGGQHSCVEEEEEEKKNFAAG